MNRDDTGETEFARLSEQASYWWVALHSEHVSASDQRDFAEWVARSPERIEAFLQTARLICALKAREVRWPDTPASELVREAKAACSSVVSFKGQDGTDRASAAAAAQIRPAHATAPKLLRFAAAFVMLAAMTWFYLASPQAYRTALGEQRSVLLDDGSLVTLNTSSQIEVTIDNARRTVRLLAGEALFQVAHDSRRPFDVIAGDTTVRAVGTQFNVDRHAANTTVTVVEGKVAVLRQAKQSETPEQAPVFLAAAERAVITESAVSAPQPVSNVAAATAWTQRSLIFERHPVAEVAAEFNRYNRQQIRIDNPELRQQEVTGVFQANDPESFIAFLSQIPGVTVHRTDEGALVVARRLAAL